MRDPQENAPESILPKAAIRGSTLKMGQAGIDFIRQNAMDRTNGGMAPTQNISKDT
jgi:hypothetical protein